MLLSIEKQGSFAVGGTIITNPGAFDPVKMTPEGQTFHGDHAYVFYQIPPAARPLPLVLWHGFGQSSKTWQTTPDGREGYQSIFLRRGFGVYVLDQPRRGNAGRSTQPMTITPVADEQKWFNIFRLGIWPEFFPGVQFSQNPEALNQYFRQMTPDTGPIDLNVNSDAVAALFGKIGPGILVTHSHSGGMGWQTVIKNENIRAVVSYEPGSGFIFPEGEVPPPMPSSADTLKAIECAAVRLHEAHQDSDCHLLRGQYSRAAFRESGPGQLARTPGDGKALGRRGKPPRWRCHLGASAGNRHSRQYPLSVLGSE